MLRARGTVILLPYTREDFAAAMSLMSRRQFSGFERGNPSPSVEAIKRFCFRAGGSGEKRQLAAHE